MLNTGELTSGTLRMDRIRRVQQELRTSLECAQEKYKIQADKKRKAGEVFKVGEKVWLSRKFITTTRPSKKLDAKFLGPFKVSRVIANGKAYELRLPVTMKIHNVFHPSLLRKHKESTIAGRIQPEPAPIVVEGEDQWEVEEIVARRVSKRKAQYLVKWMGYPHEQNSWEPAEMLEQDVPDLIRNYLQRQK